MKTFHVEASYVIDARPEALYGVIADYRVGHPAVLPRPPFTDLIVEKGGVGAGTVLRVNMNAYGRKLTLHPTVTEPEPGRVLAETDIETVQHTTFTFDPLNGGKQTRVTIASEFPIKPGLAGFMEKVTQPPFIRRLYLNELHILSDYVHQQQTVNAS